MDSKKKNGNSSLTKRNKRVTNVWLGYFKGVCLSNFSRWGLKEYLIVLTCKIWSCRQALYRKSWDTFWRTHFSQPPEVQCLLSPRLRRFVWCFLAKQAPMGVWDETECKKISSWNKKEQHFLLFPSSKEIRNEISKFRQCSPSFEDIYALL